MRVTHNCFVVSNGSRVVFTVMVDDAGGRSDGPSRRVSQGDWFNFVVPSFVAAGAKRVRRDHYTGDEVWVETLEV